jgi:hypothetical protein
MIGETRVVELGSAVAAIFGCVTTLALMVFRIYKGV